jgi:hypothetical protein
MVMRVKPVQPENAALPILVTLEGMFMSVKPVQPANADWSILVTLEGMFMTVKPVQPANAYGPKLVISLGMVLFLQPSINTRSAIRIMQFPSSRYTELLLSTPMLIKPLQLWNALLAILATFLGMVMPVKPVQF